MCLFESRASYRSKPTGLRDTAGRFIHDLATAGVPMTLASVKAASDAATRGTARNRMAGVGATAPADHALTRILEPVVPIAGCP